ncbi:ATP-binding protein [Streptomyces justiciae]|uniref:ATP-binding protein n=1 Tax=Streptomyces justiciae TaxID=2780140 RepID=UPI0021196362|nr:LuxR C-terminal-related transcriptional regulator [Streptomyces justiciae]MCW8380761.1 LuxR C-terminal-related transcriptional regulator [Streptomyces justiciae]
MELTSFVGRAAELAQLTQLFRQARLVTLVGPGGVGKTRLALRAAAQAAPKLADGIRLAELSGLRGPERLPEVVADALELPDRRGASGFEAVVNHVAARELLLVLDTCEHMVDTCALLVNVLLAHAPGLRILTTSRQPLGVPAEHVVPVPPLGLAEGEAGEAVQLFEQRAASAVPSLSFTPEERTIAVSLCRRLDGIPLAIELAAVRLRALPIGVLAARLTQSFTVLGAGRSGTSTRHQNMAATIGWSHQLCSPDERLLWARLSVFGGDFDVTAVEAVCTDARLPAGSVVDCLVGLVDKSVLLRQGDRYRLLDVIRDFGAQRLEEAGETALLRRRLIGYFHTRLREFEERFFTSEQVPLHKALLAEHRNLTASLEYADADGVLLPLAAAMWPYRLCAGHPAEARYWMDRALAQQPEVSEDRVKALVWATTFAVIQGDAEAGQRLAAVLQEQAARLDDLRLQGLALMCHGMAGALAGEAQEAVAELRLALDRLRKHGTELDVALANLRLGVVLALHDRAEAAIGVFEEVLRLVGADSEESYVQGHACGFLAVAQLQAGRPAAAEQAARRALALHDRRADVLGVALALDFLAWATTGLGRHQRAALLLGGADALFQLLGRGRALDNPQLLRTHERAESGLDRALGNQSVQQLRRTGASLPHEQVLVFALSDDAAPPAQDEAPAHGGLTRREREVAALVAGGLTNREIAERLVISKRTADTHVEHILAKLGVSSRAQIAPLVPPEPTPDEH